MLLCRRIKEASVHKIEVVVRPDSLGDISRALRNVKLGVFQASEVKIYDAAVPDATYRGASYAVPLERVKVELVVPDTEVEPAVEAIRASVEGFGESAEVVLLPVADTVHLRPSGGRTRRVTH
jgi:nitrogen regulatory protein PII